MGETSSGIKAHRDGKEGRRQGGHDRRQRGHARSLKQAMVTVYGCPSSVASCGKNGVVDTTPGGRPRRRGAGRGKNGKGDVQDLGALPKLTPAFCTPPAPVSASRCFHSRLHPGSPSGDEPAAAHCGRSPETPLFAESLDTISAASPINRPAFSRAELAKQRGRWMAFAADWGCRQRPNA